MQKRGYVRASPFFPARKQRAAIEAADVRVIYEEGKNETREDMLKSLRSGDIVVVDGYHRLGIDWPDLQAVLDLVAAKGVKVMDARTGVIADARAAALLADARRVYAGEAKLKSPKEARRRGSKGGRPVHSLTEEDKAIWLNPQIRSNAEAAALIGATLPTLYRRFGSSGRQAGWPKREPKE